MNTPTNMKQLSMFCITFIIAFNFNCKTTGQLSYNSNMIDSIPPCEYFSKIREGVIKHKRWNSAVIIKFASKYDLRLRHIYMGFDGMYYSNKKNLLIDLEEWNDSLKCR